MRSTPPAAKRRMMAAIMMMRRCFFFMIECLFEDELIAVGVNEFVGTDYPVGEGGAMGVASFLEYEEAGDVGGGYVGIDLVERGVGAAEVGEGLNHGGSEALVAVFVGYHDADCCAAVDGVVVVEFDAAYRAVVGVEGIECKFAG